MKTKVLTSLETPDGAFCIDFFSRDDGSFGFEQYRAEHDGAVRWQSMGRYGGRSFASGADALRAAKAHVPWLDSAEVWRW